MDKHTPFHAKHLEVISKPRESQDRMIKRFIRKVRDDGILQLVNFKSRYEKPSSKRRRKKNQQKFNRSISEDKDDKIL